MIEYLFCILIVSVQTLLIVELVKFSRLYGEIKKKKIFYKAAAQTWQEKYEEVCAEMRKK